MVVVDGMGSAESAVSASGIARGREEKGISGRGAQQRWHKHKVILGEDWGKVS